MCSPGLEIRSPSIFCERPELKMEFILITREMSFIFSLTVTTDRISCMNDRDLFGCIKYVLLCPILK